MKKHIKYLILFLFYITASCKKKDCCDAPPNNTKIVVFKWKANYSDLVYVNLTKDKDSIDVITGNYDLCGNSEYKLTSLINGYYSDYECHYGPYSGYLNITNEEYHNNYQNNVTNDSLMSLLIDSDPFIEFYYDENNVLNGVNDTTKINQMIRNNELSTKLTRVK